MASIYDLPNLYPPLPYVYRSQEGQDARTRWNDCGPDCCSMLLETHLGKYYTIDELSQHTSLKYADEGTNSWDLQQLLQSYGLIAQAETNVMFYSIMTNMLQSGLGVILLIQYGYIINRENKNDVQGLHWIILVGWQKRKDGKFNFYFEDPDYRDSSQNSKGHRFEVPEEQLFGAFIAAGRVVVYILRVGDLC